MKLNELRLIEAIQTRVCGALFYAEDTDKFLFVRRSHEEDSHVGCWEFPGGKIESGESWEMGLRRELREELNYRKHLLGPFQKREFLRKKHGNTEYRGYLVKVKKEFKPQLNDEHDLHRWVRWKQWPMPLRPELHDDLRIKKWLDKIEDKVDELTEATLLLLQYAEIPLNT